MMYDSREIYFMIKGYNYGPASFSNLKFWCVCTCAQSFKFYEMHGVRNYLKYLILASEASYGNFLKKTFRAPWKFFFILSNSALLKF